MDWSLERRKVLEHIEDMFNEKNFNQAQTFYTEQGEEYYIYFGHSSSIYAKEEIERNYINIDYCSEWDDNNEWRFYWEYSGSVNDKHFDRAKLVNPHNKRYYDD